MSYLKINKALRTRTFIYVAPNGMQKFPSTVYGDPQRRIYPLLQPMEAEFINKSENSPPSLRTDISAWPSLNSNVTPSGSLCILDKAVPSQSYCWLPLHSGTGKRRKTENFKIDPLRLFRLKEKEKWTKKLNGASDICGKPLSCHTNICTMGDTEGKNKENCSRKKT